MRIKQKKHAFVSSIWKLHSKYSRNGSDSAVSMDPYNYEFLKKSFMSFQCSVQYTNYMSPITFMKWKRVSNMSASSNLPFQPFDVC